MQNLKTLHYPTAEVAYSRFAQLLRNNGFAILQSIPKHNFRHRLVTTPNIDFYCLYRKNSTQYGTFERFNTYFKEFVDEHPNYKGHAESINEEVLNKICLSKYDPLNDNYQKPLILVYIYKDMNIYFTHPLTFKKFAEKYKLLRTHKAIDLKKQTDGTTIQLNEKTYHLPFHKSFFTNFNDWVRKESIKFLFN